LHFVELLPAMPASCYSGTSAGGTSVGLQLQQSSSWAPPAAAEASRASSSGALGRVLARQRPSMSFEPLLRDRCASSLIDPELRVGSVVPAPAPVLAAPKVQPQAESQSSLAPPLDPPAPMQLCRNSLLDQQQASSQGSDSMQCHSEDISEEELVWRLQEGQSLFDMLDKDADGFLSQKDARAWLRSLGWCLTDEALNALLEESFIEAELEDQSKMLEPPSSARDGRRRQFTLSQLHRIADLGQDLCGPDPDSLRSSLQILGLDGPSSSKEHFKKLAVGHEGGLSEADVDELLALCGVPRSQSTLGLEALSNSLIGSICQPKLPWKLNTGRRFDFSPP